MGYNIPLKDRQSDIGDNRDKFSGNASPVSSPNIPKNNLANSVAMKEVMMRSMRLKNINPKTFLGMTESKSVEK